MNDTAIKENKMGTMPIAKLLITISMPLMISMFVQALYNVVDSVFIAKIDENALTAISLAFTIQHFMTAVATGVGVGVAALIARYLGQKDYEKINKIAGNAVIISIFCYILFFIFGLFFTEMFVLSQTNNEEIVFYAKQYLTVVCCLSFGAFFQVTFERMLQSTGKTTYAMITQGTGAIVNLILDPILIFGLFGIPAMGVLGAAIATVIGQIVSGFLAVYFNQRFNKELNLNLKNIRIDLSIIIEIFEIGLPTIVMQSLGSVTNYFMNHILIGLTSTASALYGIFYKLQTIIFLPVMGLSSGVIPVVAYNYGAKNQKRVNQSIYFSCFLSLAVATVGVFIFQLLPVQLLSIFDVSNEMITIGVTAFRIMSLSFWTAAFGIISSSVFQSLGKSTFGMIVSIVRQIISLVPMAYLLSLFGNISFVWWAIPISSTISFLVSIYFMIFIKRKIIKNIQSEVTI